MCVCDLWWSIAQQRVPPATRRRPLRPSASRRARHLPHYVCVCSRIRWWGSLRSFLFFLSLFLYPTLLRVGCGAPEVGWLRVVGWRGWVAGGGWVVVYPMSHSLQTPQRDWLVYFEAHDNDLGRQSVTLTLTPSR